jgi:XTP/dITP diphosphohydrolase
MQTRAAQLAAFDRLLTIMDELREKCPWDRKQTFASLRHLTIEETYELADAIRAEDWEEVRRETGDLLLHMVFYAKLGSELTRDPWDIADALNGICDKLISRHPHIYGDVEARDEETVKANWEKIKLAEGKSSVLSGVPQSLPALDKAFRIQDKVRGVGFDWEVEEQVWEKVQEELGELREEADKLRAGDVEAADRVADELGDVFFALVNWARFQGIHPDDALDRTNSRFIRRFQHMEDALRNEGRSMSELQLAEWDRYWKRAKEACAGS